MIRRARTGEKASGASELVSATRLIESALDLIRGAGWERLIFYYLGTLPFYGVFVLFYMNLSCFKVTAGEVLFWTTLVTAAFAWMKLWQAVYTRFLWRALTGEAAGPTGWIALFLRQIQLHALGLILLPLSVLTLLPLAHCYAYYQNITVLDRGDLSADELRKEAWRCALFSPKLSWYMLWAISPLLIILSVLSNYVFLPVLNAILPDYVVWIFNFANALVLLLIFPLSPLPVLLTSNLMGFLAFVPSLLKTFFGISLPLLNSNVWNDPLAYICVVGLVCLMLDPVTKAAFVLRCFYADAEHSGIDMRRALARIQSTGLSLLLVVFSAFFFLSGSAHAGEEGAAVSEEGGAVSISRELDTSIDKVMQGREYQWRIPGEKLSLEPSLETGIGSGVWKPIKEWITRLGDWFWEHWEKFKEWWRGKETVEEYENTSGVFLNPGSIATIVVTILMVLLVVMALYLYWRRRGEAEKTVEGTLIEAVVAPDIRDEGLLATDLAEDEWITLARKLMQEGDFRGALRAAFLSLLSRLAAGDFIRVARAKSNQDYMNELRRRAHARPDCLAAFKAGMEVFEPVWYGEHPSSERHVDWMIRLGEAMRRHEQG